jgi:sugar phosphate isomerase/epimerase
MVLFVAKRLFGISTHLFHAERLCRDHLVEIAAHGFETVEVFATRTHFDYHSTAAIADLQEWLAAAGLTLHGIHAPVMTAYERGRWVGAMSLASTDAAARAVAVAEAETALHIARRIPVNVLVVHVGLPRTEPAGAPDGRAAARRSVEELQAFAAPLGVQIALEVIPNELSRAGSLVHFFEEDVHVGAGDDGVAGRDVGICLDFGHAHMAGDLVDAIETVSEHVVSTHVHDNGARADDHLVPFDGTIDWPAAMTAVQKVGYDGTLMFEIGARGPAKDMLGKAKRARERIERLLAS